MLLLPSASLLTLLHLFTIIMATDQSGSNPPTLNVTAISARNGASTIECWQLANPFKASTAAGVSGASFAQLGKAGPVSYALIPARFDGGLHNAPAVQ